MRAASEQDSSSEADRAFSSAVGNAVRMPLAALRASMENLVRSFESEDSRSLAVRGALDEVVHLGHEMQTLLDYALPLPLQPLSCSLREIVCAAVDALAPRRRSEVFAAIEDRRARILVDGPLLARCISRLLEPGGGSVAPALLRTRMDRGQAVFTVVLSEAESAGSQNHDPRGATAASVLGRVLARRDVERMGGEFTIRRGEDRSLVAEIRFPARQERREAA